MPRGTEVLELGFRRPTVPERTLADDITDATAEPDTDLRWRKMAAVLAANEKTLREEWGNDEFEDVADELRTKFAEREIETGTVGPGIPERAGTLAFDVLRTPVQAVAEVLQAPARAVELMTTPVLPEDVEARKRGGRRLFESAIDTIRQTIAPPPPEELSFQNRWSAAAKKAGQAYLQLAAGIPGVVGGIAQLGTSALAQAAGQPLAPGQPPPEEQLGAFAHPFVSASDVLRRAAGFLASRVAGEPAPAAAEAELARDIYLDPLSPVIGTQLALGVRHIPRLLRRGPSPEQVVPITPRPVPEQPTPAIAAQEAPVPAAPLVPASEVAAARGPASIAEVFSEPEPSRPLSDLSPTATTQIAEKATAIVQATGQAPSVEPRPKVRKEARPSRVGRALAMKPTQPRGRRRAGSIHIPTPADIARAAQDVMEAARGIAGRIELWAKPRPAPPPGQPGGPGNGVPFTVEPLSIKLVPLKPRYGVAIGRVFGKGRIGGVVAQRAAALQLAGEMTGHPATITSEYYKSGIVDMGVKLTRHHNRIMEQSLRFGFGDESGLRYALEQHAKAGPDFWGGVIALLEDRPLQPAEQLAVTARSDLVDQFLKPAKAYRDYVRSKILDKTLDVGDLGPDHWSYIWGKLGDVRDPNVLRPSPAKRAIGHPAGAGGMGYSRTTWTPPLRPPARVLFETMQNVADKLTRREVLEKIKKIRKKSSSDGRVLLDEWTNCVLFRPLSALDTWLNRAQVGRVIQTVPKPGDSFYADGQWEIAGDVTVGKATYTSPTRGKCYNITVNGEDWPVSFSRPQLAALKAGAAWPQEGLATKSVTWMNQFAAFDYIAGNSRSLVRQIRGGQARFFAETAFKDYRYGHAKGLQYWTGELTPEEYHWLQESGVTQGGELSIQGQRFGSLGQKIIYSNVYVPDKQTAVAAWFAHMNKLRRTQPGLPIEEMRDQATTFALRVSDLNLDLVQSPWGNTHAVALAGLFNKSRWREMRHVYAMAQEDWKKVAKHVGMSLGVYTGIVLLGGLNEDEILGYMFTELPFGDQIARMVRWPLKETTGIALPTRPGEIFGLPGIDAPFDYIARTTTHLLTTLSDLVAGRPLGGNPWDINREALRRTEILPGRTFQRTIRDITGLVSPSVKERKYSRRSLVVQPAGPRPLTQYERFRQMRLR